MAGSALERYIEAEATAEIEALMASTNFALLDGGHTQTPKARHASCRERRLHPTGRIALRAALEEAHGRVDQAEKWYVAAIERTHDFDLRVRVTARDGIFLQQRGRFDAVAPLEVLRAREDLDASQRAHVVGILAGTYALAGRLDDAHVAIEEALAIAEFADDELRAKTYGRAAAEAFFALDEDAVERFVRESVRLATDIGAHGVAARSASILHSMHLIAGRLGSRGLVRDPGRGARRESRRPYAPRALACAHSYQVEAERGNAVNGSPKSTATSSAISYRWQLVALFGLRLFGQTMSALHGREKFTAKRAAVILIGGATCLSQLAPHQVRSCALPSLAVVLRLESSGNAAAALAALGALRARGRRPTSTSAGRHSIARAASPSEKICWRSS